MEWSTARLRLDALRADDAAALFAYRADPVVARFQGWRPADVAAAREFIAAQTAVTPDTPGGWFQRAIRLREGSSLIGDLGLQLPAATGDSVEFGISIAPAFQRRGYAREVARSVFDLLFGQLGRHRVHASVDPRNLASMALMESLGLRQEGHFRESLWLHGEWVDDVVFALLAREWRAGHA
jgi:RimJ/RimL family protein N-acetyltransferase